MSRKGQTAMGLSLGQITILVAGILGLIAFLAIFFGLFDVFLGGGQKEHGAEETLALLSQRARSLGVDVDGGMLSGLGKWINRVLGIDDDSFEERAGGGGLFAQPLFAEPLVLPPAHGAAPMGIPVGEPVITSCWGERYLEKGGVRTYDGKHDGLDFRGDESTPVLAARAGKLVQVCALASPPSGTCTAHCGGLGNTIVIDHGGGLLTRYSHLSRVAPGIAQGGTVEEGAVLGYVGTTGCSLANHLDFKVFTDGVTRKDTGKNPLCFFTDAQMRAFQVASSAESCNKYTENGLPGLTHENQVLAQECADDGVTPPAEPPAQDHDDGADGTVRAESTIIHLPQGYALVGFDRGQEELSLGKVVVGKEGGVETKDAIRLKRPDECGIERSCMCALRPEERGTNESFLQFSVVACSEFDVGTIAGTLGVVHYSEEDKWFSVDKSDDVALERKGATKGGRELYPLLLTFSLRPRLIVLRYYPEFELEGRQGLLLLDPTCYSSEYGDDGTCMIGEAKGTAEPIPILCDSASLHSSLEAQCESTVANLVGDGAECDEARSAAREAATICPAIFADARITLEGETLERTGTYTVLGRSACVQCLVERDPAHAAKTRCALVQQAPSVCEAS